jgi:Restriction endonuclease
MKRSRGMTRYLADEEQEDRQFERRRVFCQGPMKKRVILSETHRTASDSFEQLIHRVYQLLAGSEAEVTWNDHILDPDNPARLRQIDITIRQKRVLTIVECRQHKSPQDVQWIEELIGRRVSLGAHAVIAVSSSGFTAGAQAKARRYAIILRSLQQLTDEEIANWGRRVALTLFFYQYFDLEVSLLLECKDILKIKPKKASMELGRDSFVQSLFIAAAEKIGEANLIADEQPGSTVKFGLKLQSNEFRLCGAPVSEVLFKGKARLISLPVAPSVVCGYGDPRKDSIGGEAIVETFESLADTSIAHGGDRAWTLLDLSELEVPPFCQFRFWRQDSGEELDHVAVELQFAQNLKQLKIAGKGLKVNLCYK